MSRRAAAAWLAIGLLVAAIGLLAGPPDRAVGQQPTVLRDVAYHDGPDADPRRHRLDLYLPAASGSFPAVLFLHGGSWASGDKDEVPGERYANVGRALAARGVAVALANYRLTDGGAGSVTHPAHAIDAARAAAFVRAYLIARGVYPVRLYLMGHEAGAHLAALVANDPRYLAAHGLAPEDLSGLVGLSGLYRIDPASTEHAEVFGTDPAGRRDASPIQHVSPDAPPHLLLVAEADAPGRDAQAADMAAELVRAGVPAVAEQVAGRDGDSIVADIGQPGDTVTARVLYFVSGGSLATLTPPPPPTPTPTPTASPTATPMPVAPPAQPEAGPGGRTRPHASARRVASGTAPGDYLLFVPADPAADGAPIVLFVPGAPEGAGAYAAWLRHLARGGVTVVAPVLGADASAWTLEAATALRAALEDPAAVGATAGAPAGAAYVGHGAGALAAGTVAARWLVDDLPAPRALLLVAPRRAAGLALSDLRRLPRDTRTLVVAGDADPGLDSGLEGEIWSGLADIPGAWRQLLLVRSDRYGTPALVADAAMARSDAPGGNADALDWYGTWKWLDALVACSFRQVACAYALGDTPEQRFMGRWADGTPVREPLVRFDASRPARRVLRLPVVWR